MEYRTPIRAAASRAARVRSIVRRLVAACDPKMIAGSGARRAFPLQALSSLGQFVSFSPTEPHLHPHNPQEDPMTDPAPHLCDKSALDAVPASLAVLDQHGFIVALNRAWKQFGTNNGLTLANHDVSTNYLRLREASAVPEALEAVQGIRQVLSGRVETYPQVYPCHPLSPGPPSCPTLYACPQSPDPQICSPGQP